MAQRIVSDSFKLKEQIIKHMNFDVVGLTETHLLGGNSLRLPGYQWFGHNMTNIHRKVKKGYGGVGLLVRNELFDCFNVSVSRMTRSKEFYGYNLRQRTIILCFMYVFVICHHKNKQEI